MSNFLSFIINSKCEDLFLEDIFIELIIKKDENDESYKILSQYFSFENGAISIIIEEMSKTQILKLKMIDCPLFAIKKDTFKNINNYKDISIDIDENSLLNPSIITKFKINKGFSDICFDLDSLKLKVDEEKEKDYLYYLDYIFDIIINNKDNYNFNKLKFKNFDITKYEYIAGENLTFIDENTVYFHLIGN